MPSVTVLADVVAIRFTAAERVAGLLHDLDVPLRNVDSVTVVPDGLAAVDGLRAPGLGIPGRRKLGVWRSRGRRSVVAVRAGDPALVLELAGHYFQKIVVCPGDADAIADDLRARGIRAGGDR